MNVILRVGAIAMLACMLGIVGEAYAQDRRTFHATTRGYTIEIPEDTIIKLCDDRDGCSLRMGFYNWDNSRRTASRQSLFYYDDLTGNWRAERGDRSGTTSNGATQHVMKAWNCYFTDGEYYAGHNRGDFTWDFGVMTTSKDHRGSCILTIID